MENQNTQETAGAVSGSVDSKPLFGVWTPVSEGLPEYMRATLVWCPESENTYCAYYYFYAGSKDPNRVPIWAFFDTDGIITKIREEVTHWMPTPAAPNAERRDGAPPTT